jgi:hypothetical protein
MKSLGREAEPRGEDVLPPDDGAFVWQEFWRLRTDQSLSYFEIEAYCRLTGTCFAAWELEALRAMNAEILKWRANGGHSTSGNQD